MTNYETIGMSPENAKKYINQRLTDRETALLIYIADMFGLPAKEVLKVAEMWNG